MSDPVLNVIGVTVASCMLAAAVWKIYMRHDRKRMARAIVTTIPTATDGTRNGDRYHEEIKCSHCGGPITFKQNMEASRCEHCGYTTTRRLKLDFVNFPFATDFRWIYSPAMSEKCRAQQRRNEATMQQARQTNAQNESDMWDEDQGLM